MKNSAEVEIKIQKALDNGLRAEWCKCGYETFGCYPEDGQCSCGIYKHHVHCGTCNRVSQIG